MQLQFYSLQMFYLAFIMIILATESNNCNYDFSAVADNGVGTNFGVE